MLSKRATVTPTSFVGDFTQNHDFGGDPEGRLESIIPIRADLASGDLRALYLGRLMAVQESDDWEVPEPPVPPNLDKLTEPLKNLVRYMLLDRWEKTQGAPEAVLQQW